MFLALALSLATAQAPSQAIVADLGLHVVGVAYHRSLSERVIASIGVDLYVPWTFTQNALGLSGDYRSDLAGLVLRARTYFVLWRGLWVSPFLQGGVGRVSEPPAQSMGFVGAAGASVGYAFVLFEHLLLSAGLGAQVHGAWIGGRSPPSFFGAWPHVDLIAGYIW
ncbi:MAG: hypothetical protein Q8N23_30225 [Archangium sp.]|nr:hypothetical protein [Archangium sp.]MDP3156987.1 hypothetical protein [Archangium sp.]MDP3575704.1 hypothetical protein [Archangium sp.]